MSLTEAITVVTIGGPDNGGSRKEIDMYQAGKVLDHIQKQYSLDPHNVYHSMSKVWYHLEDNREHINMRYFRHTDLQQIWCYIRYYLEFNATAREVGEAVRIEHGDDWYITDNSFELLEVFPAVILERLMNALHEEGDQDSKHNFVIRVQEWFGDAISIKALTAMVEVWNTTIAANQQRRWLLHMECSEYINVELFFDFIETVEGGNRCLCLRFTGITMACFQRMLLWVGNSQTFNTNNALKEIKINEWMDGEMREDQWHGMEQKAQLCVELGKKLMGRGVGFSFKMIVVGAEED
jgi:hypothetical protein